MSEAQPPVTSVSVATPPTGPVAPASPTPEQGPESSRPEWLPEGFDTPEQLAAEYAKLKGGDPQQQTEQGQQQQAAPETPQDARALVTNLGLDFDQLSSHFMENKELPAEAYETFAKSGFSRTMVDSYLAGQLALQNTFRAEVLGAVGGETEFQNASEWASQNLNEAELKAYNEAVESGDINRAKLAVQGLVAKYHSVEGREPNLAEGAATTGAPAYESRAQMTSDMKDPRYKKDPAFRARVEKRIANSPNLF
jgi:Phage T7 capsid assembly protein